MKALADILRQGFVISYLKDEVGNLLAELGFEFFVSRIGILDGIVEKTGHDEDGVLPVGRFCKQPGNLGNMVHVRLLIGTLTPLTDVLAGCEVKGLRDQDDKVTHGVAFPDTVADPSPEQAVPSLRGPTPTRKKIHKHTDQ